MKAKELDAACEEYAKNRERTKELVHEDKVRHELGEMEKELYRRDREKIKKWKEDNLPLTKEAEEVGGKLPIANT